ncbi:MAG: hypothetical protein RMZ41_015390 [Nostoc sp. DedVER02]|uniref:hypothetical protein n=1 Tax=unclassified Nostoc TaxID=2593658 RepID=UPI002AD3CB43|nr:MULTISPECIES: hypothetical protein [unclassified Nostoc]MDZ7988256.1 hypothetical protein [Nostoc sp. DedVER02]MDZ8113552.1 hypothetical protein [Nostoc sp. DedVER01b]
MWRISKRWLQGLGLEFWLPLPVVAIAFWLGCSFLAAQELSQPNSTENKLQSDTQLEARISVNVLLINAAVNRTKRITQVEVETADPILKRLELELPTIEFNQIEATIAQELGLPRQDVRKLVRYEFVD